MAEESQYQELIAQRQEIETGISQIDNQITQVLLQEINDYLDNMGYSYQFIPQTKIQSSIFLIDVKVSAYEVNFLITLSNNLPQKPDKPIDAASKEGDAAADNPSQEVTKFPPNPTPTPAVGGKGRNRLNTLFRTRVVWKPMETTFDTFFQSNLTQYFIGRRRIDFEIAEV
jgi:hypothetical protein